MAEPVVLVIGTGEIGGPLLQVIQRSEHHAQGVDIEPQEAQGPVSIAHICYPYEIPAGHVATTVAYAKKYAPELIIVNSTVVPGTTRQIQEQSGIPCVYSPVRGKHTRMQDELLHYTKFVAGTDEAAVGKAEAHFQSVGMHTGRMQTFETLELAKLLETTYFGLLISWAQEMERFSKDLGGDYMDAAQFFAEVGYLPRRIFLPGFIGGHCVIPNIRLLKTRVHSELLDAIVASNQRKAEQVGEAGKKERVEPIEVEPKL